MWKTGLIVPLRKKGKRKRVEGYRDVTLLNSMYKVYTMVVEKRLEKEMEEVRCCQTARQSLGGAGERTLMDNTYVLNYVVNRELQKGKRKVRVFCGSPGSV